MSGGEFTADQVAIIRASVAREAAKGAGALIEALLNDIAEWVMDLGYPLNFSLDSPPPALLWDAIVSRVHADVDGRWHGNELTRDEVDSWLRKEAGIA